MIEESPRARLRSEPRPKTVWLGASLGLAIGGAAIVVSILLLWAASYLTASRIELRAVGATEFLGAGRALRNTVAMEANNRPALVVASTSRIGWSVRLRQGTHRFGARVNVADSYPARAGGVRGRIVVVEAGIRRTVAEALVDADRAERWLPLEARFSNRESSVVLLLETEGGNPGSVQDDAFLWLEPTVEEGATPPSLAWMAVGLSALLLGATAGGANFRRVLLRRLAGTTLAAICGVATLVGLETLLRRVPGAVSEAALNEATSSGLMLFPERDSSRVYEQDLGQRPLPNRCFRSSDVADLAKEGNLAWAFRKTGAKPVDFCTDADGFRNPRGESGFDIAAVGDSFTQAGEVEREQAWPEVLASITGLSVRNFGVSAYGPQQYSRVLDRFVLSRAPRLVVVALFEGNDIFEAEHFERFQRSGLRWNAFVASRRRGRSETSARERYRRSLLGSTARLVGGRFLGRFGVAPASVGAVAGDGFNPVGAEVAGRAVEMSFSRTYLERAAMNREQWLRKPGYPLTVEALRSMRSSCARAGVPLLVVLLPSKESLYPPLMSNGLSPERFRRFVASETPDREPPTWADYLQHRRDLTDALSDSLETEGIPFLRMAEPFASRAAVGDLLYFASDTHWNPAGHRLMAEQVAEWVRGQVAAEQQSGAGRRQ